MRECVCGVKAWLSEDLVLFSKNRNSRYGRRNECLECAAARKTELDRSAKAISKCCKECGKVVEGEASIEKAFRRTKGSGNSVVGNLVAICKECEFPASEYLEMDGKYIRLSDLQKPKSLQSRSAVLW